MDLTALKQAAQGIRLPATPNLEAFSQEERDALQPFVESMEAVRRLVDGICNLPDATPAVPLPVVPPQTQVLGPEPESDARIIPERADIFRVKVTKDGGSAGDEDNNCSWTYTVTSLEGDELATGVTPEKDRYAKCAYAEPGANSPGLAYWDTTDTLKLYEALDEIQDTNVC